MQKLKTVPDIKAYFPIEKWNCVEAFKSAGVKGYEPMLAKELDTEEKQDECFNSSEYFIEEKFDGTRAILQFFSTPTVDEEGKEAEPWSYSRLFSRRISNKTGFYVENTDSVPHIRDTNTPELDGTVLDGEMFINGQPFKEVASTLNCLWEKAVERQQEKGFITFHAFDIIKYHGIDLRNMPLHRRKHYLSLAVEEADNPYIEEVKYHTCTEVTEDTMYDYFLEITKNDPQLEEIGIEQIKDEVTLEAYPSLYEYFYTNKPFNARALYEFIVFFGGEGVILKPKNGKYLHKRGWEYSKVKKFLTRDLIVIGFSEPTKEYTGKELKKWGYWERVSDGKKVTGNYYNDSDYIPVTKHYFNNQVGNLLLGVTITEEELNKIPIKKQGPLYTPSRVNLFHHDELNIIHVCECSGFDDDTREYFTRNQDKMIGTVVEVKANELFKDTGKMRHPRYLRRRFDKGAIQCTWKDHIGG